MVGSIYFISEIKTCSTNTFLHFFFMFIDLALLNGVSYFDLRPSSVIVVGQYLDKCSPDNEMLISIYTKIYW